MKTANIFIIQNFLLYSTYNLHVEHTTPASLECEQEVTPIPWWLQLSNEEAEYEQLT